MEFAALHIRTGYSCLQSGITLKNAFLAAIKQNYSGFGLTDLNTMSGYPELEKLSKKKNLQPIFGYDLPFNNDILSLFVLNETGYKNLLYLSYQSDCNPITLDQLKSHKEGLALVLDVSQSNLCNLTSEKEISEYLSTYDRIFSYFSIGLPFGNQYKELNDKIRTFVTKYPYKLIAFPLFLYEKAEDAITLEMVRAIRENTVLTEKKISGTNYFLSLEEIENYYTENEIKETLNLIGINEFVFRIKRGSLLKFPTESKESATNYLKNKAFEGLQSKIQNPSKEYIDRLNYELNVIDQMGYSDYFLIVQDYINFARNNGILVGPGRGSGGGSLVAYALDIVKEDPLKFGLLFERFLNPQRQSMPDLDVDFADYRRNEVANYVRNKYGEDKVGHIVTMITLGAKGALRDVGRIFKIADRDIDLLSKSVTYPDKSLRENYVLSSQLKMLVDSEPQYLEIVALAHKLEDLPRQTGLHPVGIVLNNDQLVSVVPVKNNPEVGLVVQFEHDELEEQGLLKMDILALRNLSIIESTLYKIHEFKHVDLKYDNLPYDDPKTIETIANLNVMGLFQLESAGMKNAAKRLKPTKFDDIVALISLFRPGPMNEISSYAARKAGKEKILYPIPELEEILKPTYGIIIYQEQIMQIAQKVAGFSYAEADLLRRAISKKDPTKINELKTRFLSGCKNKNYSEKTSLNLYQLIEKFADYGFNKSHALSYAVIACQEAYLKTYYPEEFYSTILDFSAKIGDSSFNKIIAEMKRQGIFLEQPSINKSHLNFYIENKKAIVPLTCLKKINFDLAKNIYLDRSQNGDFKDIYDFVLRAKQHGLNQVQLVSLIDGGALDCIERNRSSLRKSSNDLINYAEMFYGENGNRILLDFDIPKPLLKKTEDMLEINLAAEKDALGMMLSSSPLKVYRDLPSYKNTITLSDLSETNGEVKALGIIQSIKTITTKKGTKMSFVTIDDEDTSIEFICFERTFNECFTLLKKDKLVLITAKKDITKEGSYILENIEELKGENNGK